MMCLCCRVSFPLILSMRRLQLILSMRRLQLTLVSHERAPAAGQLHAEQRAAVQGYGPRLPHKSWGPVVVWVGVTTCILHLLFPIISGSLLAASGPKLDRSLNSFASTIQDQVCSPEPALPVGCACAARMRTLFLPFLFVFVFPAGISLHPDVHDAASLACEQCTSSHVLVLQVEGVMFNVTYIRNTILAVEPAGSQLDLSPITDARQQVRRRLLRCVHAHPPPAHCPRDGSLRRTRGNRSWSPQPDAHSITDLGRAEVVRCGCRWPTRSTSSRSGRAPSRRRCSCSRSC
jgi:hypothetical protein